MTRMNKQQVVDHWCHASRLEGVDHTRGTQAATEQSKAFLQTLMDLIDIERVMVISGVWKQAERMAYPVG